MRHKSDVQIYVSEVNIYLRDNDHSQSGEPRDAERLIIRHVSDGEDESQSDVLQTNGRGGD